MGEKSNNLLVRTATGAVIVAIVLAAMLAGRLSYTLLLVCLAAGCMIEFRGLALKPALKWFGMLYIALCLAAMWFFPFIGEGVGGLDGGLWDARIAPAFVIVTWANDTFAYLAGITFGRAGKHRLCKRISPKKTWEGFAGGILGAMGVAAIIGDLCFGASAWLWTGFGLLVALGAVAGDLAESWCKRAAGVKDSSTLLPGHGGLLDRFDAMLGAVPVAFLFFLVTLLLK